MKLKSKAKKYLFLIPSILITIVFTGIGIDLIYNCIILLVSFDFDVFVKTFSESGLALVFLMCLGGIGFYLTYYFFRYPRKYLAVLESKKKEYYKDKNIWSMTFIIQGEGDYKQSVEGYTEGENGLEKGKTYVVVLKEFFSIPIKVIEYSEEKEVHRLKSPSLDVVFLFLLFVFGIGALFLIFNFFYAVEKGIDYKFNIFSLIFCVFVFGAIFRVYRQFHIDSETKNKEEINQHQENLRKVLIKYPILKESNQRVSSFFLRILPQVFCKYLLFFPVFVLIFNFMYSIGFERTFLEALYENRFTYLYLLVYMIIFCFINILFLLPYLNCDEKLIKKMGLIVKEYPHEIKDLKQYSIFRATSNIEYEKYYIVDEKDNLLYKIDIDGFLKNKYLISNHLNYKIGEIVIKQFCFYTYIIRLVNEEPFCIRRKIIEEHDYEIIGRDYAIKGDKFGIANLICNKQGKELAILSAQKNSKNRYVMGDSHVLVYPEVINDEKLMFIAFCVTLGNFKFNKKK